MQRVLAFHKGVTTATERRRKPPLLMNLQRYSLDSGPPDLGSNLGSQVVSSEISAGPAAGDHVSAADGARRPQVMAGPVIFAIDPIGRSRRPGPGPCPSAASALERKIESSARGHSPAVQRRE